MLDEWQRSRFQRHQRCFVEIVDIDRQARLGKGKHKRDTDVARAAHDSNIGALRFTRTRRRRFGRCNIHFVPLLLERALSYQIAAVRPSPAQTGQLERFLFT